MLIYVKKSCGFYPFAWRYKIEHFATVEFAAFTKKKKFATKNIQKRITGEIFVETSGTQSSSAGDNTQWLHVQITIYHK